MKVVMSTRKIALGCIHMKHRYTPHCVGITFRLVADVFPCLTNKVSCVAELQARKSQGVGNLYCSISFDQFGIELGTLRLPIAITKYSS